MTVVPRPIVGLGIDWANRSVNADFAAGIDLQMLPCQVHPVRHVAVHLMLRARHEIGWTFEPGLGLGWLPGALKWPGFPPWLASELSFEVGPSAGSSINGVHARVAYWLLYHAIGVEAGVRYDSGRWVPALTVQLDAMLLALLFSLGTHGERAKPRPDTTRW